MMYFRYEEAGDGTLAAEELASHVVRGGFDTPVHVMLTDCTGKCAHIGFDREVH